MPLRPCLSCGVLHRQQGSRCENCERERGRKREQERGTAAERGYTAEYFANRARLLRTATHCEICGGLPTRRDPLTADHIVPLSVAKAMGWTWTQANHLDNLRPAHRSCNSGRGAGAA